MDSSVSSKLRLKLQKWKEDLAELSKRNNLLKFREEKKSTVKILTPTNRLLQILVEEQRSLPVKFLETQQKDAKLLKCLKQLRRNSNSIEKEKGINSLFVAIGTLSWSFRDDPDDLITSPILLIPVKIHKLRGRDDYELQPTEETISINPVLVQKLSADYGINLPTTEIGQVADCEKLFDEIAQDPDIARRTDWQVNKDTAFVGLFQRAKASMIKDLEYLEQNLDIVSNHLVLSGLAGEQSAYTADAAKRLRAVPKPRELDKRIDSENVFQVLEADSSQQTVIEAAKVGLSFVVQGPPGTGKSQTIVNIITELIGQNKRVLLVAEKPGALEVVFDRLNEECKLGDLCLLFHKTSKKEFSKELEASRTKLIRRNKETTQTSLFYELGKTRQLLSHHRMLLHGKCKPIEKSVFEIYGELLKLQNHKIPSLKSSITNLDQLTYKELQEIKKLLEDLSLFNRFFRGGQKSLWSESSLSSTTFSVKERARIIENLTNLGRGINLAKETGEELHKMLALDLPKTQADIKTLCSQVSHIAAAPTVIPGDWLRAFGPDIHSLKNSYEDLKEKDKQFESHYQTLQDKYNREFFSLNLSREVSQLHRYKSPLRILNPGYWKQHGRIFSYLKRDRRSSYLISALFGYKNLKSDMEVVDRYQKLRNKLNSTQYEPRRVFQPFFNVEDRPNLQEIENALEWLEGLQNHKIWKGKDKIARVLTTTSHRQRLVKLQKDLQTAQVQIADGLSFLKAHFPSAEEVVNHSRTSLQDATLDEVSAFLEQAEQELDSFRDWIDYQHCTDRLKAIGVEQFLTQLQQSSIPPNLWYSVFEQGFYAEWLKRVEDKYCELRIFSANLHEQRVREFSEKDVQQYDLACERLRQLHAERLQQWSEQPSSKKQLTLLKRESQAPKRAMGIRQFISEAADLVSVLKPCWLMSPIAVSECIQPTAIQFDAVIFDEASQIRTEYAISSIMRAKQVIVVGDAKQLPPTAFFSGISSDDDEDDGEQDFSYESFLPTCESFMERKSLNWHYRSQDESLIEFSNKEFYDSELISFPNPVKDASRGVHFHFVEGAVYGRGETKPKNPREAEEVAKLALEHRRQGQQSLGIIAFSQAQADAIEDAIQKQLAQLDPEEPDVVEFFQEDSDKYFLKSLENVQGDERNVIILSFAYGKDKEGKFLHNFGPLTKLGGERRLNVAITRAKHKLILVASVQPKELESDKENVSRLKRYFEYAQQNDRALTWNSNTEDDRSTPLLVEDIYRTLQERGYEVRRSVGASEYPIDLGVIHPQRSGEFLLGIECDSPTYHKLATVRDRDRLRRQVLEKLNWRIHRIWAKEWFYNRDAEIDRLVRQIEQLQTQ